MSRDVIPKGEASPCKLATNTLTLLTTSVRAYLQRKWGALEGSQGRTSDLRAPPQPGLRLVPAALATVPVDRVVVLRRCRPRLTANVIVVIIRVVIVLVVVLRLLIALLTTGLLSSRACLLLPFVDMVGVLVARGCRLLLLLLRFRLFLLLHPFVFRPSVLEPHFHLQSHKDKC